MAEHSSIEQIFKVENAILDHLHKGSDSTSLADLTANIETSDHSPVRRIRLGVIDLQRLGAVEFDESTGEVTLNSIS